MDSGAKIKDIDSNTIIAITNVAHSLYQSLNEERLFTEEEVKERQMEQQKSLDSMLSKQ